jgi:Spy/CpxP family protein refolding chaperone
MKTIMSKMLLAVLTAALVFAAIPVTNAYAADEDPPMPSDERLERLWARQARMYERTGKAFEDTEDHIARFQEMIDNADEKGLDTAGLQDALDAYEDALTDARPDYEALGELIDAHDGFDDEGNVTDSEQAYATVQEVREQAQALKEAMSDSFKTLREAIKTFREENRSAEESKERDS